MADAAGPFSTIGKIAQKKRQRLGMTQDELARKAGYSEKTVRKLEAGVSIRAKTVNDICEALGLPPDAYCSPEANISDETYGAYNLAHFKDYQGVYWGNRRNLRNKDALLRTVFKISWSHERRCLTFHEDHRYKLEGQMVDFSQSGDIYTSNEIGLLHLVTSFQGAVRLITLSKLRRQPRSLDGIVLTQMSTGLYFKPAVSPIYLEKIDGPANSETDLRSQVGPILPGHELYDGIAAHLREIETEMASFSTDRNSATPIVTKRANRRSPIYSTPLPPTVAPNGLGKLPH